MLVIAMPRGSAMMMSPWAWMPAAESGLRVLWDARPVHYTAQNRFKDIMAQRGLCSEGRASLRVVDVSAAESCPTGALHGGGV
jgi:hypothetical protein